MKLSKSTVASLLLTMLGLVCMSVYLRLCRKSGSKRDADSTCKSVDRNDPIHEIVKDLLRRDLYDL